MGFSSTVIDSVADTAPAFAVTSRPPGSRNVRYPKRLTVPIAVPDDPELCGVYVFLQALEVDPGAAKGISSTAGLMLFLGD